jgi:hypothetical protein
MAVHANLDGESPWSAHPAADSDAAPAVNYSSLKNWQMKLARAVAASAYVPVVRTARIDDAYDGVKSTGRWWRATRARSRYWRKTATC